MSGILGIVNFDGTPVDRLLLRQMVDSIAYHGPDAQNIWLNGPVGFGHTALHTTPESKFEKQPCSLDGQVWITADARIDARDDLRRKLASRGRQVRAKAPDVELILHAYHAWGDACVEHILGDFAFAIWDARQQRLFCARDHYGIKPFYYAYIRGHLIISNNLYGLLQHPAISQSLNEQTLGDFLLFGGNPEPNTTFFADVQCLAPAHTLTLSQGFVHLERYWMLQEGHIRYKRADEYVEHFRELLLMAVKDRLRTSQVGVLMSGGMDSTSVTATAHLLLTERSEPFDLRAYTQIDDPVINNRERYNSGLVADALDIPIHYTEGYSLYADYLPEGRAPVSIDGPMVAQLVLLKQQVNARYRVCLMGHNGDPLLTSDWYRVNEMLRASGFWQVAQATVSYRSMYGRRPPLGLRTALRRLLGLPHQRTRYPTWINPSFEERTDLCARWEQLHQEFENPELTPVERYTQSRTMARPHLHEEDDPGMSFVPVEARYPLFDVRLAEYIMAIPPAPWCLDKHILREAMRDQLPAPVRLDSRIPHGTSKFIRLRLHQEMARWTNILETAPGLTDYVNVAKVVRSLKAQEELSYDDIYVKIAPLSLAIWLHRRAAVHSQLTR